eukprot:4344376-Prymnesium_polylepis.1
MRLRRVESAETQHTREQCVPRVRDGAIPIEIGSGRVVGPIYECRGEIGAAVGPISVIHKK